MAHKMHTHPLEIDPLPDPRVGKTTQGTSKENNSGGLVNREVDEPKYVTAKPMSLTYLHIN